MSVMPRLLFMFLMLFGCNTIIVAESTPPQPKIVKGESCVEPTDFMRRYHMQVLNHQRDETVIHGVRTPRHSLTGCISCHADKDADNKYIPVNAEGQFCSTCHTFAAVKMDCFQCHATVPYEE